MSEVLTREITRSQRGFDQLREEIASTELLKLDEHAFAHACSMYLTLPGLRGFWPMSSFNESGNAYDLSGQGRTLSYNGDPTYNYQNLIPYIDFDGVGDRLERADEAGIDITGGETYVDSDVRGITLGGWFRPQALTAIMGLITKSDFGDAPSYALYWVGNVAGDPIRFMIEDGVVAKYVTVTPAVAPLVSSWYFLAGRYRSGINIKVWANDESSTVATVTSGTILNTAFPLCIGCFAGPAYLYTGFASMCFLCTTALADDTISALYYQSKDMYGA